jgi:hypothetical protein
MLQPPILRKGFLGVMRLPKARLRQPQSPPGIPQNAQIRDAHRTHRCAQITVSSFSFLVSRFLHLPLRRERRLGQPPYSRRNL